MEFDVLNKGTSIVGKRVLEASAGTGKTFAIEHLFLRLLLEKKELPQILVVTFTQAAARELRERIRKNMEKALEGTFPYLDPSSHFEKIKEALDSIEEANIYTIHGFCLRAMKEFAFESDLFLEEEEEKRKFHPYAKKFLRNLDPSLIHPFQISALLQKYKDIESICQKLAQEVSRKQEPLSSYKDLYKEIEHAFLSQPSFDPVRIKEDFLSLFPQYKLSKFKEEELLEEVELLTQMPSEEAFFCLGETKLALTSFLSEENRKKRTGKEPSLHHPDFFPWVEKKIYPLLEKAKDPVHILRYLAILLDQRLQTEEGFFTPDEILKKMRRAVEKESFIQKVKRAYPAVIIDEFQDTDPLQWEIFSRLFLGPSPIETFYIVGDPKQSIYGFRNADVYTYLQAAQEIGKENTYILGTNFRSSPSLVQKLNRLFQKAPWLVLPKNGSYLPFFPVKAGKEEGGGEDLHFFAAEGKSLREAEESFFFSFIASKILFLKKEGLSLRRIAILVKDRFQGEHLEDYLRNLHLPCQRRRNALRSDSSALSPLKDFFRAVLAPQDESRVKIALLGPFLGYSLQELEQGTELFWELKRILQTEGLASFFSAFLEEEKIAERFVENPALYQDTAEIIEALLLHAQKENIPFEGWDGLLEKWEHRNPEEKKREILSEEDALQILTIHMSKGLEFDVVFALGVVSRTLNVEENIEELDAEKMRQLYVAFTRAKKSLYVPLFFDQGSKTLKKGEASPLELFFFSVLGSTEKEKVFDLLQECGISHAFVLPETVEKETLSPPILLPPFPKISLLRSRSVSLSFSSLKKPEEHIVKTVADSSLPSGSLFGTYIHRILEVVLSGISIDREKIKEIVQREQHFYPFQDVQEKVIELVEKALYTPVIGEKGFLADIPYQDRRVELEFFSSYGENFLKGFIDLLFRFEGKYYLLDWKTNDLESYTENYLKEVLVREQYDLQAAIYTDALRKFLGEKTFSTQFGGMFYVFLRGGGILHLLPDLSLLQRIASYAP